MLLFNTMVVVQVKINKGWLDSDSFDFHISHKASPHCDDRECDDISLLVIHNISLPPGKFGSNHITDLFLGQLNPDDDDYFKDIYKLRVSAHLLVRRDGSVIQYVPLNKRAWHAGVSEFCGRQKCNDYSIGIEMEGTDDLPYTESQYSSLATLTEAIMANYPDINKQRITGHCHIAPGRKTDPGESFDWQQYFSAVADNCILKQ
ncbi:1,6-anhydro-N-acetylmuramyl-L-alanine amidase AmpD [Thalassotalea sp. HSM 43]|uniref:1,6-anhydro-N-acetylmuramyl-L-alanine amidase AmpD n=1 Tax=Thalassotalea sp. HSM 43 TaxID=2552945 RepID=UPI001E291F37|nr:1,6-anhydro-N-acetylmuramyl-L-alanine amidase AmpD [Thalassotalea sp. HSM 43]